MGSPFPPQARARSAYREEPSLVNARVRTLVFYSGLGQERRSPFAFACAELVLSSSKGSGRTGFRVQLAINSLKIIRWLRPLALREIIPHRRLEEDTPCEK